MPLSRVFDQLVTRTRKQPKLAHLAGAATLASLVFALRMQFDGLWGASYPLVFANVAVLFSAALFSGVAGITATALSAAACAWFYMPPTQSFIVERPEHLAGLAAFALHGILASMVIETLHHTAGRLRDAQHHRTLLLREFRHRARNDLQSLASMLTLRARGASPETRSALVEAARYARDLARVHRRLETADAEGDTAPTVDTHGFIHGLCFDLDRTSADGLRPIALNVHPEPHLLDTERAVSVGMVLAELLQNAYKYAFPEERHGTITVEFRREGDSFVLSVRDDGIGLPSLGHNSGVTLGTRLLRGLAAQLRGSFTRGNGPEGGCHCELRFPAEAPHLAPSAIGVPL